MVCKLGPQGGSREVVDLYKGEVVGDIALEEVKLVLVGCWLVLERRLLIQSKSAPSRSLSSFPSCQVISLAICHNVM